MRRLALPFCLALAACGSSEWTGEEGVDLPLGELGPGDDLTGKADGWGYATTCKPIPAASVTLAAPRIVVSLKGLTLHLIDDASGWNRVYPIGPGAINTRKGETTYGRSLSMYPPLATKRNDFTIKTAAVDPCKIWWTDPESGQRSPVFAGMPFIPWYGSYGIHGPITGYTAKNGGQLQRGYVSHGCIRMESADVLELWSLIRARTTVPVRVQEEVERATDGLAVDLPQRWLLSECRADADCNFTGGTCLGKSATTGRGFCSVRCSGTCSYDKYGYPVSFCVADASTPGKGFCTLKSSLFNWSCKRYDGFQSASGVPRFGGNPASADVCLP